MSYNELLPWRALAQRIPKDVLNPTHRYIIVTLLTYESADKGAYFKPENIASELGLSYRAVMDNFHYLGSGLVWKAGVRQPCANPECKAHLGIIKTSHYARSNRPQTYRVLMKELEKLASMHSGAHSSTSMHLDTEEHAPENLEHAPEGNLASTPPHAYIHNKQLIDMNKRNHVINLERWEVITSGLSEDTKRLINPAPNTETLLDRLELGEYLRTDIRDVLAKVNFATAHKVGGLFVATLEGLAGVKSTRETSAVAWCGECDKETRQFEEASIINGVETYACETCSPYAKQLKITRNEAPNSVLSRLGTAFKSIDD